MRAIKLVSLGAFAFAFLGFTAAPSTSARAQGSPPNCPYGYYDYAPYNCAPDGYYGPQWFNAGIFIGAGPWFHGSAGFRGSVNNHLSPQHGYKGAMPKRGAAPAHDPGSAANFHGNETRDGRGHVTSGKK